MAMVKLVKENAPEGSSSQLIFCRTRVTPIDYDPTRSPHRDCRTMIDSGSRDSWIDRKIAKALGIEVGGKVPDVLQAGRRTFYHCQFQIILGDNLAFRCSEGMATAELPEHFDAVIGLDILSQCWTWIAGPHNEVWVKRVMQERPQGLRKKPHVPDWSRFSPD